MSKSKLLFVGLLLLGCVGLASSMWADGIGSFLVVEKLKTAQCGSSKGVGPLTFTLTQANTHYGVIPVYLTWSAMFSGNNYTGYVGRYYHLNPLYLQIDADGLALLTSMLANRASELCETLVTPSDVSVEAILKVNKRQTAAKLQINATMALSDGSGSYSLKGRGHWTNCAGRCPGACSEEDEGCPGYWDY
jgi:hypothetical protein